jgi:hypothetical protein
MARRSNEEHIVSAIGKMVALLVLAAMVLPNVRQRLIGSFGFGSIAVTLIVLFVVGTTTAFLAVRLIKSRRSSGEGNTPEPVVENALVTENTLQSPNLTEQIRAIDWFQFEKLVALIYRKLGYAVSMRGGAKPDGGIDLVIERSGERTAVQCKHWKSWNVGIRPVREFVGALAIDGISKGVFITLGGYTAEAKQLAGRRGIEMVDDGGLMKMLDQINGRSDVDVLAILIDKRKICPKCEREMVLRTATKGIGAGRKFWGCSTYPRCRFTMPV